MLRLFNDSSLPYLGKPEPQRPLGDGPKAGHPFRYDQPVAAGSRYRLCQRTVGEDPLPGHFNEPLGADPHAGWCGARGENPGYPIMCYHLECPRRTIKKWVIPVMTKKQTKLINSSMNFPLP